MFGCSSGPCSTAWWRALYSWKRCRSPYLCSPSGWRRSAAGVAKVDRITLFFARIQHFHCCIIVIYPVSWLVYEISYLLQLPVKQQKTHFASSTVMNQPDSRRLRVTPDGVVHGLGTKVTTYTRAGFVVSIVDCKSLTLGTKQKADEWCDTR